MNLKITNGALDDWENSIVLRGSIVPSTLNALKTDRYQREAISESDIKGIAAAMAAGARIPDIEIGARTDAVDDDKAGVFTISGETYIIDGYQRVTAARRELSEGREPRLGCLVHFGTTEKWERERFETLNTKRKRVSPNIHLRNATFEHPTLRAVRDLLTSDDCPLRDRVCWSQYMRRNELLSAATYLKTICRLHGRFAAGKWASIEPCVAALAIMQDRIGRISIEENVKSFFRIIEEVWGIRNIAFKNGASHLKSVFLFALARVFSDHQNFWKGNRLQVERDIRQKLSSFPLKDPTVQAISGGNGTAFMYQMLVNHINSGKRTKRLEVFTRRDAGMAQTGDGR